MDKLQIEAMQIRNEAVRPLLLAKEVDCWTALSMVVAPSEELKQASLEAALARGITEDRIPDRIKIEKAVVSIEELVYHAA
jgi:hypothetical protein